MGWRGQGRGTREAENAAFKFKGFTLHEKTHGDLRTGGRQPPPSSLIYAPQKIRIKNIPSASGTLEDKKSLSCVSFCPRVKTSFLGPSRECWREGEQWGAQPEPLSSACSQFHGLRQWFAFLGQQPALGKQETSRQASLLHTKWHEQARGHNRADGVPRSHCFSLQTQALSSSPLTHKCPTLSSVYGCRAPRPDLETHCSHWKARLYYLACCLLYKFPARLREKLYLPAESCSSESPFLFLPLWSASWG